MLTGAALKDPETWRSDWERMPFEQCLGRVLSCGTTPNGVFAAKIKWRNMPYFGEMLGALPDRGAPSLRERLDDRFPHLRYVWVSRRDKVRQAVSPVEARQSHQGKSMSAQPQSCEGTAYNFHLIDAAMRQIVNEERFWTEYFTHAGITPFTIIYEDLVHDYQPTLRRLLRHLQIDLPSGYAFPPPRLHKQADAHSDDWVRHYHRNARSSWALRAAANLPAMLLRRRLREAYVLPHLRAHLDRLWERNESCRSRLLRSGSEPERSVELHAG